MVNISIVSGISIKNNQINKNTLIDKYSINNDNEYKVQWEMNYGSSSRYGARYEGPQPIGDCDNDGDNEILIAGRDSRISVMEWDENKQTYLEKHTLRPPFYPTVQSDAGGFAIGDLTGDGKNEIAATWNAAVYKWINGKYRIIGLNSWIFDNGGGNGDCYIGDCDNDGKNELIMSGGPLSQDSNVPEIVVFEWNGFFLVKDSEWDNPDFGYTYIYMAGVGDVDYDGENEIVLGSNFKVIVLDWNKQTKQFDSTVIKETIPDYGDDYIPYPFACVCKDSDMDGKAEIHVGYMTPEISVFEWNGEEYITKFETSWEGENSIIEALDVGDVDNDGINELCAGTNLVHILQWNGETYVEEAVLPTYGWLAVLNIGDCDNDGFNELNAGAVGVSPGQDYMSWTYKYQWQPQFEENTESDKGNLKVIIKSSLLNQQLGGGSIAAWNLETGTWYDIPPEKDESTPEDEEWGSYIRNNIPIGTYLLRAVVEGYQSQEKTIVIEPGETTDYTFTLSVKSKNYIKNPPLINFIYRFSVIRDFFLKIL